jgi:hypothetical protein
LAIAELKTGMPELRLGRKKVLVLSAPSTLTSAGNPGVVWAHLAFIWPDLAPI